MLRVFWYRDSVKIGLRMCSEADFNFIKRAFISPVIQIKPVNLLKRKSEKMKRDYIWLHFLIVLIISSCSSNSLQMGFGQVSYVNDSLFVDISASENQFEVVPYDVMGILDIKIEDSLLFISAKTESTDLVKCFDCRNKSFVGSFMKKGRGPGEVTGCQFFDYWRFLNDETGLFMYAKDSGLNLIKIDVKGSMESGITRFEMYSDSIPDMMSSFYPIDDTTLFVLSLNRNLKSFKRGIWDVRAKNYSRNFLNELDTFQVSKDDFYSSNLLSSLVGYNKRKDLIVEANVVMNTIHIYSLDRGDTKKTICLGDEIWRIDEFERKGERYWINTFGHIVTRDDYFAVLYHGLTDEQRSKENGGASIIYFFDWDGSPLQLVKLPFYSSTFDLDDSNGFLYALDSADDCIMRMPFHINQII